MMPEVCQKMGAEQCLELWPMGKFFELRQYT
jgi:hypothetical protein